MACSHVNTCGPGQWFADLYMAWGMPQDDSKRGQMNKIKNQNQFLGLKSRILPLPPPKKKVIFLIESTIAISKMGPSPPPPMLDKPMSSKSY